MNPHAPHPVRRLPSSPAQRITLAAPAALAALVVGLVVAGCGARPGSPLPTPVPLPSRSAPATASAPPASPGDPTAAPSDGLVASPSTAASPSPGNPTTVNLVLEPFVGGLESPVFATGSGDGSGRLFVVEQPGRIRIVRDGRLLERPFLDIAGRVSCCGERGLLGLAFVPGDSSRVLVDYTDRDGDTVVSSFTTAPGDPDLADPGSERVVLRIAQPYANHNGGMIAVGPDGFLYIGTGDGGSGGDPQGSGQDLAALLGKLLRIDVAGSRDEAPYAVPTDNPYVGVDGAAPEVWATGLRNPWRFSFDRTTGDLWIGDVGQSAWEEIDRAPAADGGARGANFGWNRVEGAHCFPSGEACAPEGLAPPIAEYGHDQGCAVTGGYVYRGTAQPALSGIYLFGDYCSGRIWGLAAEGPDRQEPVALADGVGRIASFGQDDAGELYVVDLAAGRILRIVAESR